MSSRAKTGVTRILFILLSAFIVWVGISYYTASSNKAAADAKGWLYGFLNKWRIFFEQNIPPEEIALEDSSGKSYRCTGYYPYPEKIETSGLFYDSKNKRFLTVADKGIPQINEFTLSDKGIEILSSWNIRGQDNLDFEGIDMLHVLGVHSLLISCERTTAKNEGQVLIVDPVTRTVSSRITVPLGNMPTRNTTFEGIAVDNRHKQIYLAKERNPLALFILDHKGRLLGSMNEQEFIALYREFADEHKVEHRLDGPISASLSGLDFEDQTGILTLLNRSHRQILLARNRKPKGLDLEILDILSFRIPENSPYGCAEGVAVADFGKGRSLILITDPGPGGRPNVTVFDYPRMEKAF